ncbi:putative domain HDIG-containing protein [Solitalea canadensis DSM 3403]|uniref:Putative domain HDIG-containing protein n=2 Tax=Solitalea canadensis TaxID=995 RepID=H8KVN3_SOLCM|nr:putative domain HDIG-containing protein [Solitalea canadensis DSM 3403]
MIINSKILRFFRVKYADTYHIIMLLSCIMVVVLILPKEKRFKYEYEKGKVWMHSDLVSPFNFAIEKTPKEITADKKDAIDAVLPVYKFADRITAIEQEAFKIDFDTKWKAKFQGNNSRSKNFKAGIDLIDEFYKKGIIELNNHYQKKKNADYYLTIVQNNVATNVNSSALYTPSRALDYAKAKLNKANDDIEQGFLLDIIQDHVQPNVIFDENLTQKLERESEESVSLYKGMVQKGELIVAKNDVVTDDVYKKIESLRKEYEQTGLFSGKREIVALGQVIVVGISLSLLIIFLYLFRKDIYNDYRQLSLILIIVTGMLVALSWAIKIELPSIYYIPYCIVPIIIRLLFDARLALNIHILVVLIAGFFVPNGFEFTFFQITAGMTAIYSIQNLLRRSQYLVSAFLILLTYLVCFAGVSFIHEGNFSKVEWIHVAPFVLSVLLSLLAYPMIYLFEKLFGVTSDITLMELSNTNNPLLRELAFKAPGTFQHSMQVANLAEAAIYKIGGNALLVRTGALYHDIGKMRAPNYFIENQKKTGNPHDELTYEESARIIIRHVTDGVEIAQKNRIPDAVIDFIRTHHGNTRVDYFYQSFLKNFPDRIFDEQVFRYPGPIPFSKETGVLMLADSVEAASRTLKDPDARSIDILVEKIINYKLEQQQLINTDITLKDIETIKQIFKQMLMSIYHVRVEYQSAGIKLPEKEALES